MIAIKPCPSKTLAELTSEWDKLADRRHRQIVAKKDISFEHIVVPAVWKLLEPANRSLVLDVGAGTGNFTLELAHIVDEVIAVEPSSKSIELAKNICKDAANVRFFESSLEKTVPELQHLGVTAAVAVMTLMNVPDLRGFANAVSTVLKVNGYFVALLTHPWFWPKYWEYENESWFDYKSEIFIEAPFCISHDHTDIQTTHIHRPLEYYLSAFAGAGLRLDAALEPVPTPSVEALYPTQWKFPRFLGLRWVKPAELFDPQK